jgi:DNA-binding transcriptional ArsR family regulator
MPVSISTIERTLSEATEVFFALGEPARQQIILLLAQGPQLNVGQLAERLPLSRPAISHHLKVLKKAQLVTVRKRGTENLYALAMDEALVLLKRFVHEVENCG